MTIQKFLKFGTYAALGATACAFLISGKTALDLKNADPVIKEQAESCALKTAQGQSCNLTETVASATVTHYQHRIHKSGLLGLSGLGFFTAFACAGGIAGRNESTPSTGEKGPQNKAPRAGA